MPKHPALTALLIVPALLGAGIAGRARAESRADAEYAELLKQVNEAKGRLRQLEARLRQLDARRSASARVSAPAKPDCTVPFFIDGDGLKHLRLECANAPEPACDLHLVIDEGGIKRVRSSCDAASTPADEPK